MTAVARPQEYHAAKFVANGAGGITFQHAQDLIASIPRLGRWASNYNFPAITGSAVSGGTLTATALATMTFTAANPCPYGVNGADTSHYLYISGGTGTAEAVLITGGTAVAGGTSGTLTFIPANNHSGAWTITSASGGIKEADIASGAAKTVFMADGTYTLRAPVVMSSGSSLIGESVNGVSVVQAFATGHGITISGNGARPEIAHFKMSASATVDPNYFLINASLTDAYVHHIYLGAGWGMLILDGCARCWVDNILMAVYTRGIQVGGAAGASGPVMSNIIGATATSDSYTLYCRSGLINLTNFDFQHTTGGGSTLDAHIIVKPETGEVFSESTFAAGICDGSRFACIQITPAAGGAAYTLGFSNIVMTGGSSPDHMGIVIGALGKGIKFNQVQMRGVGVTLGAVQIAAGASDISFDDVEIGDFSAGGTTAVYVGVGPGVCKKVSFKNCSIGYTEAGAQDGNCAVAIDLSSADHTDLHIANNDLYGVATYANVSVTKTRWKVVGNTTQVITLAAAATLALGLYDDGQVIELTGATGVATAITGLREGQYGTFLATNAGNVAFSAVATIGKAFTALQNIPVPWVVYGGKLYGTCYVS